MIDSNMTHPDLVWFETVCCKPRDSAPEPNSHFDETFVDQMRQQDILAHALRSDTLGFQVTFGEGSRHLRVIIGENHVVLFDDLQSFSLHKHSSKLPLTVDMILTPARSLTLENSFKISFNSDRVRRNLRVSFGSSDIATYRFWRLALMNLRMWSVRSGLKNIYIMIESNMGC